RDTVVLGHVHGGAINCDVLCAGPLEAGRALYSVNQMAAADVGLGFRLRVLLREAGNRAGGGALRLTRVVNVGIVLGCTGRARARAIGSRGALLSVVRGLRRSRLRSLGGGSVFRLSRLRCIGGGS